MMLERGWKMLFYKYGRDVKFAVLCMILVGLYACKDQSEKPQAESTKEQRREPSGSKSPAGGEKPKLPWIQDDFNRAKSLAEKDKKPLVIDMWAGWCHTCLSMKNYVLNDPSLMTLADRFVWLEVDTEKIQNAMLIAKYPPSVWPTFLVLGGKEYGVQARHLGATSASRFREFLLSGERGHLQSLVEKGTIDQNDPLGKVRSGDRLALAGKPEKAYENYMEAIRKAPDDWSRKPEVLLAALTSLYKSAQWPACMDLGLRYAKQMGNGPATADFLSIAKYCSEQLERNDPRIEKFEVMGVKILEGLDVDANAPLSADDRSEVLRILRQFHESRKDQDKARRSAEKQLAMLDDAAAKAPGPQAAATYNWPRAEVYVYLGQGAKIIAALEKSVRDLPKHYDPPYRLAWVLYTLGEYDRAHEEAEKALKLAYGPRKARIYGLLSDIQVGRKDFKAALGASRNMLELFKSLPEGQKNPQTQKEAQEKILKILEMQKKAD